MFLFFPFFFVLVSKLMFLTFFISISSLGMSRWLTKEELEALLVENISTHDVRTKPFVVCVQVLLLFKQNLTHSCGCFQYNRFIQIMERLLSMPYCNIEEEFVLRFRHLLQTQSRHQMVSALQKDENGVAFSSAEGMFLGSMFKTIVCH